MKHFRRSIMLLAACLLLSTQAASASPSRELDWILHLPSLSVTTSERHEDSAEATATINANPAYALDALRQGLAAHGWTLTRNAATQTGALTVYAVEAQKRGMSLQATIQNLVLQGTLAVSIHGRDSEPAQVHHETTPVDHPIVVHHEKPAPTRDRVFNDNGTTGTYPCNGNVAVNGNGVQITLTGRVESLTVNGNGNAIRLAAPVRAITVNGRDNDVTWSRGHERTLPSITNNGENNSVHRQ